MSTFEIHARARHDGNWYLQMWGVAREDVGERLQDLLYSNENDAVRAEPTSPELAALAKYKEATP